jgi:hypothetical protein
MAIGWIAPAALAGLALIAVPIAIHLLVRQHGRTLAYPSLRFLRQTQLASLRQRTIQDAALLLCRVAIVALAAMALAGPILETDARTVSYASRTSRAVVIVDAPGERTAAALMENTFTSALFRRSVLADALSDAVRWLNAQPPSSREIVIGGTLRRGSVTAGDLALVPQTVGVRFDHTAAAAAPDIAWPILTRRNGSLARVDRALRLEADATRITDGVVVAVADDLITMVATDEHTALAQAALRAALNAGVPWREFDQRVVIVWEGADASAVVRAAPSAKIIRMPVPSPPSAAADAVRSVLEEQSPSPVEFEPVMIAPEQLAAWTRPGAFGPADQLPSTRFDEGDRRWVWALVLALLALEAWMRRSRSTATPSIAHEEARVA